MDRPSLVVGFHQIPLVAVWVPPAGLQEQLSEGILLGSRTCRGSPAQRKAAGTGAFVKHPSFWRARVDFSPNTDL